MPAPINLKKFNKKLNPFTGKLQLYRTHNQEYRVITSGGTTDINIEDEVILIETTDPVTLNLPDPNSTAGHIYTVKKKLFASPNVNVDPEPVGTNIDGDRHPFYMGKNLQCTRFYSDGIEYWIIGNYIP